jgi:energy-coupling factor transporter transmembrane protein EcfT
MTARGLHRAAPLANGLLLLCIVGAVLASPSVLVSLIALVTVAVLAIVSGERPTSLVPWRRFVLFFAVILFVAQALSVHSGAIVLTSPFRLTTGGLLAGARMAFRFLIILGASALFVRTTDSDRLAGALATRTSSSSRCGLSPSSRTNCARCATRRRFAESGSRSAALAGSSAP